MKKRVVVAAILVVPLAASAYAQTPLFHSVLTGTLKDVQAAVNAGADLNARDSGGCTPLIDAAAYNKDPEVVTMLLKAGSDIEAQDGVYGGTALCWAANNSENPEVVTTLLKAGADIKANGGTVLLWAVKRNANPEVIMILLHAGADAKAKDEDGKKAFDYARGNERAHRHRRLEATRRSIQVSAKGHFRGGIPKGRPSERPSSSSDDFLIS